MKRAAIFVLGAFFYMNSVLAAGVELTCNKGALEVSHQFDSNLGHNYVIQIRDKGVIEYFNQEASVFRDKSDLEINALGTEVKLTHGYLKSGFFEAEMFQLGDDGKVNYSLPTYVKVRREGAGAHLESYLPQIGAGPHWYFESCN